MDARVTETRGNEIAERVPTSSIRRTFYLYQKLQFTSRLSAEQSTNGSSGASLRRSSRVRDRRINLIAWSRDIL